MTRNDDFFSESTGKRTVGVNGRVANFEWILGWRKIFKDHQLDVTSDGYQTWIPPPDRLNLDRVGFPFHR